MCQRDGRDHVNSSSDVWRKWLIRSYRWVARALVESTRKRLWQILLCLPALAITAGAIARSAGGWNDYRGYIIAGDAIRQGVYSDHVFNNWPPFFSVFAVVLAELARLPAPIARVTWATFNAGMFALGWSRWLRAVHAERDPVWLLPAAFFFVSPFLAGHLVYHQVNALIFAMAVEAFLCAGGRKDARAGIWIGLAASLKATPILLLPYFLVQRRWKLAASAVAVMAACAVAVVPMLGWRAALDAHGRWLERTAALRGIHGTRNQSIHALVERLATNEARLEGVGIEPVVHLRQRVADAAGKLLSLTLVIVGSFVLRKRPPELAAASLLAISVLSATYCWRAQYVVFAPLLYLVLRRMATRPDPWDWLLAAPFLLTIIEREQTFVGEGAYQVLEGAGLTCLLALLLVVDSLRPRFQRGIEAAPATSIETGMIVRA
jgi:glycosyl transferase family 87